MDIPENEELKSEIRASLCVIRFIVQEKAKVLGKKNTRLIERHILRAAEYMEKLDKRALERADSKNTEDIF